MATDRGLQLQITFCTGHQRTRRTVEQDLYRLQQQTNIAKKQKSSFTEGTSAVHPIGGDVLPPENLIAIAWLVFESADTPGWYALVASTDDCILVHNDGVTSLIL
jgi:hypothetical protein